jgi:hypothetical protein
VLTASVVLAQAPQPRVRVVPYTVGKPITERLLPDDQVVVVSRLEEGAVFVQEPTPLQMLRTAVDMSDVVVVIEVSQVIGTLVEEGTWIRTRVVGAVQDVMLSRDREIVGKQGLEIEADGGEVLIGKVVVKASQGPGVEARKRYLMFLMAHPNRNVWFLAHLPLLIDNGKLVSTRQTRDPLDGLTLAEVTKEVQRLAKPSAPR